MSHFETEHRDSFTLNDPKQVVASKRRLIMKKNQKIKLTLTLLLFIPAVFGCFPGIRKEVVSPPQKKTVTAPFIAADILDKKIDYLERALEEKRLDNEDKKIAVNLLSAYKIIRSTTQKQLNTHESREIIRTLFTNLSRLDEKYFSKERFKDKQYPEVITLFSLKKKKILDDYLSEDYQAVISGCLELEATFGPNSLTPEIGLLLAVSLAKKGMVKEAVNIGESIIHELEGRPDLIHLRSQFVEWQLDLGNREKALQIYEKLIDNLDEKETVFKRVQQKVAGEERKTARLEKIPNKDESTGEAHKVQGPMEKLLMEVDKLVQRNAFTKAKMVLIKQRIRSQERSEIETIDQALKTVDLAEEKYQKEQNTILTHEEETLQAARRLIEEENFEQAIAKLEELRDDRETNIDAKELRELTIEKFINHERNKAAKLFLMAKRSTDPGRKEELLLSSYKILKSLIDKYPSSTLINKLNNHLNKVRQELVKLGKDPGD